MVHPDQCHPVRPLRRDAEQNRQRILRAAAEVFTTRGLQASLDDVARHAGVGVGTVYRRFPDKESLVEALFEERLGQLAAIADKALAEPDSWTGLTGFLEQACELLSGDRGLREILMFATYGRDRVQAAKTRMQPLVTALVERAQRDGKLRADLHPTDMLFIEFMLTSVAGYAEQVRPQVWRRYLALVTDALLPARAGTTPLPVPALAPDEMTAVMRSIPHGRSLRQLSQAERRLADPGPGDGAAGDRDRRIMSPAAPFSSSLQPSIRAGQMLTWAAVDSPEHARAATRVAGLHLPWKLPRDHPHRAGDGPCPVRGRLDQPG
jgi:AcrR family transcriptional regulator